MSCQKARLVQVAEHVAEDLAHAADPAERLTVERTYAPDWLDPDFWSNNPQLAQAFAGRRAYVFGTTERQEGPATRAEDENNYGITVVVFELYTPEGSEVPPEWLDERIAWVERCVYDRLGSARDEPVVPDADAVSQEWVSVYSPDLLRRHKLFRSEVVILFRKVEDTR